MIFTILITYILIWTPLLLELNDKANIGFSFLCFTFSIILYSKIFEFLILIKKLSLFYSFGTILLIDAFVLLIIYITESFVLRLCCFSIINGSFGFLMPGLSTMKSQILTEEYRTVIMSVYKVPTYFLSILTILMTIWFLKYVRYLILFNTH